MKKIFLLSLFFICLTACSQQPKEFHHSVLQFGTVINITLYDVDDALAEKAFKQLDTDFEYFHSAWTPYEPSSLSRVNSLIPTGGEFSVGPSVLPLIKASIALAEQTDHLYNPAIGKLIKLWQMHKHDDPAIKPPDDDKIADLVKQNPRMTDLVLNGIRMHSENPAVELNFGAYAKGHGVDLSIELLKSMGIENAIINTGGDLKAIGTHGDRPWSIAIKHPRKDSIIASIDTQGEEAVFTSGDYERYYMHQGKRYHHILDPRTGYPAQDTQSVTVIHHNSALADVAATALFVAGPDHWHDLAKKLDITQVMLIDQQGKIHVSPDMHKRLQILNENETTLIVSAPL
jgi:thiamine biosynthesis lipoprotein